MKIKNTRKRLLRFFIGIFLFLVCIVCVVYGSNVESTETEKRTDVLVIDKLNVFGKLERPGPVFLHQAHTDALKKLNKDCSVCHKTKDSRQSLKFQRFDDANRKTVMDLYHAECIGCHTELMSATQKSGPVTCGDCHKETIEYESSRIPVGFDLSLHYRHSGSQNKKCESCHHEFNNETKKLTYIKGNEGTCRYCHKSEKEENRISMRAASHQDCIACHQKTKEKNNDAGPVECSGCHDSGKQLAWKIIIDVPRMEMKQPDTIFVKKALNLPAEDARMKAVPFDHRAHEQYNKTCRSCHHADMKSCATCHSLSAVEEKADIPVARSMHQVDSEKSCIGCHNKVQEKAECAGCHSTLSYTRTRSADSCNSCHLAPVPEGAEAELPDMLIAKKRDTVKTYNQKDVPEIVEIKIIKKEYQAVKLPHRAMVNVILDRVKKNNLASYFHDEKGTMCQGCHHNSPAAAKPPKCASCHAKPFDSANPAIPGLKAAYHRQCFNCHKEMDVVEPKSTDCTACHKKKEA